MVQRMSWWLVGDAVVLGQGSNLTGYIFARPRVKGLAWMWRSWVIWDDNNCTIVEGALWVEDNNLRVYCCEVAKEL